MEMDMEMYKVMNRPPWRWGMPAPIWLDQIERIRDLVTQWNLEPISRHYADFGGGLAKRMEVPDGERPVIRWPFPFPFPGGLRYAHLHLDDKIFVLNDEQWSEFSKTVVNDMQERLGRAGRVNVQQITEISEAIMGL